MTQAATLAANASLMTVPVGTAPAYSARAWVNFNGTGTVAIRASGNVSSITDNGTGEYTVNFTTAMTDVNYAVAGSSKPLDSSGGAGSNYSIFDPWGYSTSSVRISVMASNNGASQDAIFVNVAIFR